MAMTYEEALRKAAACLRLAKSSNPNEAALAAAKAQEIMDRYNITIAAADLDKPLPTPDEPIQDFNREEVITACQKDKNWTLQLTLIVARANGCKTYFLDRNGGCASYLIGRASDVNTARYMIGLLAAEVRRLNREHCLGYSEKYRRDFKYGVVDAIRSKFADQWNKSKQAVRNEAASPMALMRIDSAIAKIEQKNESVEKWAKENTEMRDSRSNYRPQASARQHGYAAGQTINISNAKAGIGRGAGIVKH